MYKAANDMSPDMINEVFKLRNTPHYNLRYISHFLWTQSVVSITELNQHVI